MYDPAKASEAQEKYCQENNAPHFAPNNYNRYQCYRCNQNIYAEKGHPIAERLPRGKVRLNYSKDVPGYSVERASSELITGCPFCYASYCD